MILFLSSYTPPLPFFLLFHCIGHVLLDVYAESSGRGGFTTPLALENIARFEVVRVLERMLVEWICHDQSRAERRISSASEWMFLAFESASLILLASNPMAIKLPRSCSWPFDCDAAGALSLSSSHFLNLEPETFPAAWAFMRTFPTPPTDR